MTEHVGYYCPRCDLRYVRHACKNGLPCRHSKEDAFYTFRWDSSRGFKRFIVTNRRHGVLFDVRYLDRDQLAEAEERYCEWLRYYDEELHQVWLFLDEEKKLVDIFKAACRWAGGEGFLYPPPRVETEGVGGGEG